MASERTVHLAIAVAALSLAPACVDLCVLSGAPCDSDADCASGKVCRLRRGFELGCLFAAGSCVAGECGSVDACPEGTCCDPDSNRCVAAADYDKACDARTCRGCAETCFFPPCSDGGSGGCYNQPDCGGDGTCGDALTACDNDYDCPGDRRCEYSMCRLMCTEDTTCPTRKCLSDHCTVLHGTPCSETYDSVCGGLSCYSYDLNYRQRPAYCTSSCYGWSDDECPCGFTCANSYCSLPAAG